MRRKSVVVGVSGVVVLALVIFAVWPREKEPVYQGKKLSEWLTVYSRADHRVSLIETVNGMGHAIARPEDVETVRQAKAERSAASEAVQQIGTNAVPILLSWISYERPRWRKGIYHFFVPEAELRAWLAVEGFETLGQKAVSALPELRMMSTNVNRPETAQRAIRSLGYFGENGFSALMGVVSSGTQFKRAALDTIASAVRFHRLSATSEDMREATPRIISVLSDPDILARKGATNLLQIIAPEALTNGISVH